LPKTDVSLKIDAKDGVAEISAEATALNYAPATLKASMPFRPRKWADDPKVFIGEAIEGNLKLPRLELSRFQSLIPGAERLGGVATGEVVIRGTVGDPKVDGRLNLSGGSLKLEGDVIPGLEGVNFDIQTDLGEVTIKGEVDDLEGGNLTINGTLGLKNESGEGLGALDVSVRGRGVPVVRNDFLIMRANMDLNVKGTMESSLVSGEVGVIDSVFYKDIELIPIGKPFLGPSPAALPALNTPDNPGEAVPEAFQEWTVNVSVKTVDPILIRGNLGEGEVDASLRIEGKLGNPQPTGTVRLRDTAARLPFSTLEVSEGTLTFSPKTGFDPIVELRGNAEPRPYRIQVYAYGRMSDPQLVLTSQPPLPENEIMTLLATGTTSLGLEDSQAAASRATQLLIEELRRGRFLFGKQLRPVLGLLDNMDFSIADQDPYDSDSYNSATLKLSDKWFISAGLGAEGDQRVMAIYRLRIR
jgi:autotransporter translocation and assembly factor TamB